MEENIQNLVENYEKERKKTRRRVLFVALIVLGAVLIVTALLFRTQYPFVLEDKGLLQYHYSHVLLRDVTKYDYFNNVKDHRVLYYIVYRNGSLYYEQETNFTTYSAHAKKENVEPGITNHSVIQTTAERYTYLAKDGRTYCFEKPVGKLGALFEASYAEGKIYWRFACYVAGAACIVLGALLLKKSFKGIKNEEKQEQE
ncbi:MAG: hypothetical protein IJJ41_02645 [Clostridia bacterium]|nr:hypothetical protein [Clostridia bacterium]